jgi:hypothetical protein
MEREAVVAFQGKGAESASRNLARTSQQGKRNGHSPIVLIFSTPGNLSMIRSNATITSFKLRMESSFTSLKLVMEQNMIEACGTESAISTCGSFLILSCAILTGTLPLMSVGFTKSRRNIFFGGEPKIKRLIPLHDRLWQEAIQESFRL